MSRANNSPKDNDYFASDKHWVIDFLGSQDVIAGIIGHYLDFGKAEPRNYVSHDGLAGLNHKEGRHGVVYIPKETHWVAWVNEKMHESYVGKENSENTQLHSHLCQSFATYNFIFYCGGGLKKLVKEEYVANSKEIATMLLNAFNGKNKVYFEEQFQAFKLTTKEAGSFSDLLEILTTIQNYGIE